MIYRVLQHRRRARIQTSNAAAAEKNLLNRKCRLRDAREAGKSHIRHRKALSTARELN